ncbi:MAG: hypothetical protein HQ512_00760 [Rhodospirillales bacterium]|nr:hypothetical protein [Rhodospirillales bacterium]
MSAATTALVIFLPLSSQAFECPRHLAEAELTIQTMKERFETKHMAARVALSDSKTLRARTLLTNARITLLTARMLHDKAWNPPNHARAIAKADAAKGFALATNDLLASR